MYHSHWACPPTRLPGDDGTNLFRHDLPLFIFTMTISILQWNVRGFQSQRPYLLPLLDSLHPSVLCLQETHLQPHSTPTLPNFHPALRQDRPCGRGGGVAIFLHSSLPHIPLPLHSPLEVVATQTFLSGQPLTICSIYKPLLGPSPTIHYLRRCQCPSPTLGFTSV